MHRATQANEPQVLHSIAELFREVRKNLVGLALCLQKGFFLAYQSTGLGRAWQCS